MANELKRLIREAFNIAYTNHKSDKLNEGAKERGKALTPAAKEKADIALQQIISNPAKAIKYSWDDSKKAVMNYIVDSLVELYQSTKEPKYKEAIGNMFIPTPERITKFNVANKRDETKLTYPKVYWNIFNFARVGSPLDNIYQKDPKAPYEAMIKAWARLFKGGTVLSKATDATGARITTDVFDRLLSYYTGSDSGQGFAGAILKNISDDVRNQMRGEKKYGEKFIPPPQTSTGKDMDFGDEGGLPTPEEEIGDNPFETLGGTTGIEGGEENVNNNFDFRNYQEALRKIVDTAKLYDILNPRQLVVFEETMLNYKTYDEIADKYPNLFPYTVVSGLHGKSLRKYARKPGDILKDLITRDSKESDKFLELLKKYETEYNIPSIANTLFPIIDRRAHTELETVARFNKQNYVSAVKEIINVAQTENIIDTKSLLAFEGFLLDGLSYQEIMDENPGVFDSADTVRKVLGRIMDKESPKNAKFRDILNKISEKYGFDPSLIDNFYKNAKKKSGEVTGAQWISKTGKEMMAQKNAPAKSPEQTNREDAEDSGNTGNEEPEDETGYLWEKFVAENIDKIMERVYKRLTPKLNS